MVCRCFSFSKGLFSGSMLVFVGVVEMGNCNHIDSCCSFLTLLWKTFFEFWMKCQPVFQVFIFTSIKPEMILILHNLTVHYFPALQSIFPEHASKYSIWAFFHIAHQNFADREVLATKKGRDHKQKRRVSELAMKYCRCGVRSVRLWCRCWKLTLGM